MMQIIRFYFVAFLLCITTCYAFDLNEIESPKNGIKALHLRDESSPIVSISFAFEGGSSSTALKKSSVLNLTTSMLLNGIGQSLLEANQEYGINISLKAEMDFIFGELTTPLNELPRAIDLFRSMLRKPDFDKTRLNRLKEGLLRGYKTQEHSEDLLTQDKGCKELFGDHPAGRSQKTYIDSLKNVRKKDLRKCLRKYFAQDNLIIGFTGNLSPKKAGKVLDKMFGFLPKESNVSKLPDVSPRCMGQTHHIIKERDQTKIIFFQPALKLTDPNITKSLMLTGIMGIGPSSRLFNQLRQVERLVYSVDCHLNIGAHGGAIIGKIETSPKNASQALHSIKTQWNILKDNGVSENEFNLARRQVIEEYPFNFLTSRDSAHFLLNVSLQGHGKEYFNDYTGTVMQISLDEINQFAKEFIKPEALSFIVLGRDIEEGPEI